MSDIFWAVYKFFNDPPGTPKEMKCIGCKVAGGCTCMVGSAIGFAIAGKKYKTNFYLGSFVGLASLLGVSAGVLAFKLANDDYKYNQRLVAHHKEHLSKTRLDQRANNQNVS